MGIFALGVWPFSKTFCKTYNVACIELLPLGFKSLVLHSQLKLKSKELESKSKMSVQITHLRLHRQSFYSVMNTIKKYEKYARVPLGLIMMLEHHSRDLTWWQLDYLPESNRRQPGNNIPLQPGAITN